MDRTTPVRQVTSTTKCNSPELSHSIDLNRFSSEDLYASLCSESIMHPLGLKGAQERCWPPRETTSGTSPGQGRGSSRADESLVGWRCNDLQDLIRESLVGSELRSLGRLDVEGCVVDVGHGQRRRRFLKVAG